MAYEMETILRFEGRPPTEEELEDMLGCIVIECIVEEV